jgi:hypothetical protein
VPRAGRDRLDPAYRRCALPVAREPRDGEPVVATCHRRSPIGQRHEAHGHASGRRPMQRGIGRLLADGKDVHRRRVVGRAQRLEERAAAPNGAWQRRLAGRAHLVALDPTRGGLRFPEPTVYVPSAPSPARVEGALGGPPREEQAAILRRGEREAPATGERRRCDVADEIPAPRGRVRARPRTSP